MQMGKKKEEGNMLRKGCGIGREKILERVEILVLNIYLIYTMRA